MVSTALSAQSLGQDQVSPKEQKAKQKAELAELKKLQKEEMAALKIQQKEELAKFIENQKNPQAEPVQVRKPVPADAYKIEMPRLMNGADSAAYLFGAFQSKGLKDYVTKQLGVDPAHMNEFYRGMLDRASADNTDPDTKAYNAGVNIGGTVEQMASSIQKEYYEADPDKQINQKIIASSLIAALTDQNKYTVEDAQQKYQALMQTRKAENTERLYGPNREAGIKFLEENAKKEGVVTLPSGVQYKVLTQGTGKKPLAEDKVKVNYEGRLIDGTVFDSSYKREKPSEFKLNQVIKGWTEAMQEMPQGSTWEIYIPQELAYGERNTGMITPFSALIFKVELLEVISETPAVKPAASTAARAARAARAAAANKTAATTTSKSTTK